MKHFLHKAGLFQALLISTLWYHSLEAFDLPVIYRTPFFQGTPKSELRDWRTLIDVSYSKGSTSSSWNHYEKSTELFNGNGPFNLAALGFNVENVTVDSKPQTYTYLRNIIKNSQGTITDGGDFAILGEGTTVGNFVFSGALKTEQISIDLQQNLFSGFFAHLHLPLRHLSIQNIAFTHVGDSPSNSNDQTTFNNFLLNLNTILNENALLPLTTPFERTDISELVLSAGWQGYDNTSFGSFISSAQGAIQTGIVIPIGSHQDLNHVFAMPLGYNGHWGVNARLVIQANAFTYFALGAQAGTTLFFTETHFLRLATSQEQNGWIHLETGRVSQDLGPMWDLGCYLKADHILKGLSALVGYSFVEQESSTLKVDDPNFLKTLVTQSLAQDPPMLISRDTIASSDARLGSWRRQSMHFLLNYDFGVHMHSFFVPEITLVYNVGITGRKSFKADMYGGTLGLHIGWTS